MAKEQLLLLIKAETQKAVQEMKKMNNSISKTQAGIKKTVQGFKNFAMKALVVVAAVKGLVTVFKSTTQAYEKQLAAETKLVAALKATGNAVGITADEMKAFASEMQQTTVFGDDVIINAQAIMTTFTKIGKEAFPQAIKAAADMSTMFGQDLQQSVIQLGTALNDPIAGVGRLKRIGISFSEEQKTQIKNFMDINDLASAQAVILDELGAEFGGVSEEMGKTPIGIFKKFNNTMSDLQETVGMFVMHAAAPLIESFTNITKEVTEFLKSEEGITKVTNILKTLAGAGSIIFTVFEKVFGAFKEFAEGIGSKVAEELDEANKSGKEGIGIFNILGGFVEGISIAFAVLGKMIDTVINHIHNLIKNASVSVDVLKAFASAITDPLNEDKWKAVGDAGVKALTQFVVTEAEYQKAVKETGEMILGLFASFGEGATKNAEEIEKNYEEITTSIETALDKLKEKMKTTFDGTGGGDGGGLGGVSEEIENIRKEWEQLQMTDIEQQIAPLGEMKENFIKAGIDKIEVEQWYQGEIDAIREEAHQKEIDRQMDIATQSLAFADQMVSGLSDIFGMHYNNQGIKLDNQYKKEKEAIEKNVKNEEAKNKALAKLDEQYAQKRGAIKTKQAKQEKTWGVIQSVIDTATAVMKTFAQLGFPFGIPAAIAVGAMGIAKTAMIASQPIPKFQQGGSFTVPPGYENDSFQMGVNSGEEINIRRPDQSGQPIHIKILLGGDTIWDKTYQATVNGELLIDSRALV